MFSELYESAGEHQQPSAQVASAAKELEKTAAELADVRGAHDSLEEQLEKQTAQTAQRQQVRRDRLMVASPSSPFGCVLPAKRKAVRLE